MIPNVYGPHQDVLVNYSGLILMRYHYSDNTWYISGGVAAGAFFFEQLGPGDYVYQVWLVRGRHSPFETVRSIGNASIIVLGHKK
jgi:hypothetical protein